MRIKLNEYNNIEYCYNRLAIMEFCSNNKVKEVEKNSFAIAVVEVVTFLLRWRLTDGNLETLKMSNG